MTQFAERLALLEATMAEQQAEITRLRKGLVEASRPGTSATAPTPVVAAERTTGAESTRRSLLKTGALAAGAALAGTVATPTAAAAADADEMVIGADNVSGGGNTRLRTPDGARLDNANILTVSDGATSSAYEAAIGGVAQGNRITNGMYAYTETRTESDTSTGHAVVARQAPGGRSHIYMPSSAAAPPSDSYAHARGELRVDNSGILWYCVANGTPGTWRRLAGATSSGAVHAISPSRVYDSRFSDGPLAGDANRLVSVADRIDVSTGAVDLANMVPPGATAVYFNVTITSTVGQGFLGVSPGNATAAAASTINWSTSEVTVANASLSTLDTSRQLRVFAGGTGSATHFIVDITGYTL